MPHRSRQNRVSGTHILVSKVRSLRDTQGGSSADVIDACVAALTNKRSQIRAGAVVADVRLSDQGSDAIRVDLEHAEGHALTVLLPYTKKKLRRGIDYGQIRAQAGHRRIWA